MKKLSKSKYILGLQCPKALWLSIHRPELQAPLDEGTKRIFEMGHLVGKYAQARFPGGVLIDEDHMHLGEAIRSTEKAVAAGATAIFEATAAFGGALCRVDILFRRGKRKREWDLFEVKSSTGVKNYHLDDVSFQRHCFENAGYEIRRTLLMHVNNKYVRDGAIEPKRLLHTEDVTELVVERMEGMEDRIENLLAAINQRKRPEIAPGVQCASPFVCLFFELCNKRFPYDIYELPCGGQRVPELEDMNIRYLKHIPDDFPLSDRQRRSVQSARSRKAVVDTEGIRAFLETLEYPLYFFDFETVSCAVPPFNHSRPYEFIPFQFSLHVQKRKDGPVEHHAFLHEKKSDPRKSLIRSMLKLLGKKGSIVAYNMSFEKTVIGYLIDDFPEHSRALKALLRRFKDLKTPFSGGHYVHRDFHGSASLKAVLPVLAPSLSYDKLDIRDGGTASFAYERWIMGKMADREWRETYRALLKYCELDTLAMVEILKRLYSEKEKGDACRC
ncbi:MAG: DUF2779 domain-containing protein [Pseudomonadota bacterium]